MPLKVKKSGVRFDRWGYAYVLPFVIAFLMFQLVPLANTLLMGFTDLKGASNDYNWVGLSNFAREDKNIKIDGLTAEQARTWVNAFSEKGVTFETNAPDDTSGGADPFAIDLNVLSGENGTQDPPKDDTGATGAETENGNGEANSLGNTPDMFSVEGITENTDSTKQSTGDTYYIAYSKMKPIEYDKIQLLAKEIGISQEQWDKGVTGQMAGVIFDGNFYKTIWNNLIIWFFNFIPQILFALIFAVWLTDIQLRVRAKGIYKTIFYMPNVLMTTAVAVLYASLFASPGGPVNQMLVKAGVIDKAVEFYRDGTWTRAIVAFIQFWMWFGPTMIIIIAGIVGISSSLFESAIVDGASKWQIFRFITLPMLRPVMSYVLVTSIIGGLQMFEIPFLLTNRRGDPQGAIETPSIFIYNQAFGSANNYSYASALSMGMFIIILVLAMIVFAGMRDKDEIKASKMARQLRRASK